MRTERSAGIVTYFTGDGPLKYLLLHYGEGHWGFPKGGIHSGETVEDAALRELAEETGIQHVFLHQGFTHGIQYYYTFNKEPVYKEVIYFLAQSPTKEVVLSNEHIGFRWLGFDMALKAITFSNDKETLTKAHQWITTKGHAKGGTFSGHGAT